MCLDKSDWGKHAPGRELKNPVWGLCCVSGIRILSSILFFFSRYSEYYMKKKYRLSVIRFNWIMFSFSAWAVFVTKNTLYVSMDTKVSGYLLIFYGVTSVITLRKTCRNLCDIKVALGSELLKQVQSLDQWRIFLADKFNESTGYAKTQLFQCKREILQ